MPFNSQSVPKLSSNKKLKDANHGLVHPVEPLPMLQHRVSDLVSSSSIHSCDSSQSCASNEVIRLMKRCIS